MGETKKFRRRVRAHAVRLIEQEYRRQRRHEMALCRKLHKGLTFLSAKKFAQALILWSVKTDENGRNVGLTYEVVLDLVKERFPIITYHGPHTGKPIVMTVKQLREIAYSLQSEKRELRLPVRPRSRRQRKKSIIATPSPQKATPGTHATLARRKG